MRGGSDEVLGDVERSRILAHDDQGRGERTREVHVLGCSESFFAVEVAEENYGLIHEDGEADKAHQTLQTLDHMLLGIMSNICIQDFTDYYDLRICEVLHDDGECFFKVSSRKD